MVQLVKKLIGTTCKKTYFTTCKKNLLVQLVKKLIGTPCKKLILQLVKKFIEDVSVSASSALLLVHFAEHFIAASLLTNMQDTKMAKRSRIESGKTH